MPGQRNAATPGATRSAEAELRERLAQGPPLLLDGATGTELERRGVPSELPLWSARALLEAPELLARIHAEYVAAGAEVVTANTFRTQRRTLAHAGLAGRTRELTRCAVELARRSTQGAPRRIFVAGSMAPLEDCWRPDRVPEDEALAREHAEHAENLRAAGVDLLLLETFGTLREALAALRAARTSGLPVWASFACDAQGRLLSGEPLAEALAAARALGPLALLVNCLPPSHVEPALAALRACGLPFGVYPNLGAPTAGGKRRTEELDPAALAALTRRWVAAGARIVGGCCGTTPAHLRALAGASPG